VIALADAVRGNIKQSFDFIDAFSIHSRRPMKSTLKSRSEPPQGSGSRVVKHEGVLIFGLEVRSIYCIGSMRIFFAEIL